MKPGFFYVFTEQRDTYFYVGEHTTRVQAEDQAMMLAAQYGYDTFVAIPLSKVEKKEVPVTARTILRRYDT